MMEYSTTAKNKKERVEPVFVSDVLTGKELDEKINDRFRIILFTDGSFPAEINNKYLQIISPSVVCLSENDAIKIDFKDLESFKCRVFFFNPRFLNKKLNFKNIRQQGMDAESEVIENRMLLKSFINSEKLNYCRYIKPEDNQRILELMNKSKFQLEEQDSGWWPCKTRSFLTEILFFIAQLFELRQDYKNQDIFKPVSPSFKPILDYIARFYNKKITLESLCCEFGTNRTDLNKRFNEETGMSAISYIIDLRLRVAYSLLKDTDLPVSIIAEQTGFSDTTHFERQFKQKYESTPLEVRK